MNVRKQLRILLSLSLGGLSMVALAGIVSVVIIRGDIIRLSQKTSPLQVNLAKLQRGFERISGNFARISAASHDDELQSVEKDTEETLAEVERIATELSKTSGSLNSASLEEMRRTHRELRTMADDRLKGRRRMGEAYQNVAREISGAVAVTQTLSKTMAELQKSSQDGLIQSKKTSQESNASIKAMLVLREKLGQIQPLVQEVRLVDKKYRLNVLKDKVKGVLDTMSAQEVSDANLSAQVKTFVEKFDQAYEAEGGLLSLRADMIANPQDVKIKEKFEDKAKALNAMLEGMGGKMLEAIDPLELSVQVANNNMNKSTEQIAAVAGISATTAEVNARARTLQGLAWQLLAAGDVAAVDQAREQIAAQDEQVQKNLAAMAKELAVLQRKSDSAAVQEAARAFQRVHERLTGNGGIASVVRQGLEQQAKAEHLFTAALQSIRQIAQTGSERARDAEGAQADAVGRIQNMSTATIVIMLLVGLLVMATSSVVGRKIQKQMLAAEAKQLDDNEEMRRMVETVRKGNDEMQRMVDSVTQAEVSQRQANEGMRRMVQAVQDNMQTLRQASQDLTSSCEAASGNIESAAGGANEMQTSIVEISNSVSQAAGAGAQMGSMIQSSSQAFDSLNNASKDIARVTHVIRKISSRTHLLALNATIEASSAGEAGRGFAVVASEVKALAQQVAEASEEIDARVKATQQEVERVQAAFEQIRESIEQISAMQGSIVAAVAQQTATTRKIGENIRLTAEQFSGAEANGGIRGMAQSLSGMASELDKLCGTQSGNELIN